MVWEEAPGIKCWTKRGFDFLPQPARMNLMSTLLKKVVLSFLSGLVLLFSLAPSLTVNAQAPAANSPTTGVASWYDQNFFDWYDKVYNENTSPASEIFGERYTAAQVQWVFYSVLSSALNLPYTILGFFGIQVASPTPTTCILGVIHGNLDIKTCTQSLTGLISAFTEKLGTVPQSSNLASSQSLWADVFSTQRPLSFFGYTANIVKKLNPVSEVHAQATTGGFGFSRLLVISEFWKITRNAAYAILIIAVIAIAFMIMFRVKISPQAAITIQSTIPQLIITLILITFSLAIAGLMVDLMYVVIGFIASLFAGVGGMSAPETYSFMIGAKDSLLTIGFYFIWYLLSYLVASALTVIAALSNINFTSTIVAVILLIGTIILLIILFINWFKVIFMLFKTVALIYVAVIVAPLQLMMGVFPGPLGQGAFSGWLKGLVSKLAVFPVTGILVLISFKFVYMSMQLSWKALPVINIVPKTVCDIWSQGSMCNWFTQNFGSFDFWGPPLMGQGGPTTAIVFLLISVGAILMIPKVADMVEGFLSGKPIGYGAAIGEALGPVTTVGKMASGSAVGYGAAKVADTLGGIKLTPQQEQAWYAKGLKELVAVLKGMNKSP